jgi:hypothetical protein
MFRKHTTPHEPRIALRQPKSCSLFAPGLTGRIPAALWEASATECALTLGRRLRAGDMVLLEADGCAVQGLRVTQAREGGGGYLVRADFLTPLSHGELNALLAETSPVA